MKGSFFLFIEQKHDKGGMKHDFESHRNDNRRKGIEGIP